tara:strand:+ start:757 stop:1017 length:261 start_codon:yes stop_codon:yes gene_type:complete
MPKTDGEAILVKCSNCECPIAEVWKLEEKTDTKKLRFICGQCGDHSFDIEVNCKFYFGSTEYCAIGEIEDNNNLIKVKTIMVKEYE